MGWACPAGWPSAACDAFVFRVRYPPIWPPENERKGVKTEGGIKQKSVFIEKTEAVLTVGLVITKLLDAPFIVWLPFNARIARWASCACENFTKAQPLKFVVCIVDVCYWIIRHFLRFLNIFKKNWILNWWVAQMFDVCYVLCKVAKCVVCFSLANM